MHNENSGNSGNGEKNEKNSKKSAENENNSCCICTRATGLFVPNRELSYCVAGGLLGLFFVFMAGFFWGQQHAIKDFLHTLNQDSFADQVASSLYVLTDPTPELPETEQEESGSDTTDTGEGENDSDNGEDDSNELDLQDTVDSSVDSNEKSIQSIEKKTSMVASSVDTPNLDTPDNENSTHYYAQLIGFGTVEAADQFVNRITRKGFPAKVEKRTSKTAKGKKVSWYQVVTDAYLDKAHLERVVQMIVWQEKLKDVRIVTS